MYVVENPTTVVSPSVDITTLWWGLSDILDLLQLGLDSKACLPFILSYGFYQPDSLRCPAFILSGQIIQFGQLTKVEVCIISPEPCNFELTSLDLSTWRCLKGWDYEVVALQVLPLPRLVR